MPLTPFVDGPGNVASGAAVYANDQYLEALANGKEAAFTTYKTILWGGANATNGVVTVGGTYFMFGGPTAVAANTVSSTGLAAHAFRLDPADFAANARTTKLRLVASCIVNGAAPATNIIPTLFPVALFGGAAGATPTIASLGVEVSGARVTFTTPAASSSTFTAGADFNFPAAGWYVLALITGGGFAVNAQATITAQLQMRQV